MYTAEFTKEQRKIIYDAVFECAEYDDEECIRICEKIRDDGLV